MGANNNMEVLPSDQGMFFKNNGDFFLRFQTKSFNLNLKIISTDLARKIKYTKKTFASPRSLRELFMISITPEGCIHLAIS